MGTREGPQLKKGKRVSVVEEWVFDGSVDGKQAKIAYVSRPERGWLALSELDPLPELKCADQEDKMMEKISLFLRPVEKSCKKLGTDDLKQCLMALERREIKFVI